METLAAPVADFLFFRPAAGLLLGVVFGLASGLVSPDFRPAVPEGEGAFLPLAVDEGFGAAAGGDGSMPLSKSESCGEAAELAGAGVGLAALAERPDRAAGAAVDLAADLGALPAAEAAVFAAAGADAAGDLRVLVLGVPSEAGGAANAAPFGSSPSCAVVETSAAG